MSLVVTSCRKDEPEERPIDPVYPKTVIMYVVGENGLATDLSTDINEILSAKQEAMGEKDKIVLYLDNTSLPMIYTITKDTPASRISDLVPEYTYPEDVNSCTYDNMLYVLNYVARHHVSSSYAMVFASHGSGWIPKRTRSFGVDNGHNTTSNVGDEMDVTEIRDAIRDSEIAHMDYLFFDCCFMQNVEVAYELKDVTDYIIASPAEIPAYGAPYLTVLKTLFCNPFDATELVKQYAEGYKTSEYAQFNGVLLSAVKCSAMPTCASFVSEMLHKYEQQFLSCSYVGVNNYFEYPEWGRGFPDYYDLDGIMYNVVDAEDYSRWLKVMDEMIVAKSVSDSWFSAFNNAFNRVDTTHYSGISMHLPLPKYDSQNFGSQKYYETSWAKKVWSWSNGRKYVDDMKENKRYDEIEL